MKIQIRDFLKKRHRASEANCLFLKFNLHEKCTLRKLHQFRSQSFTGSSYYSINWVFKACVENLKVCCKKKQLFLILQKQTLIISTALKNNLEDPFFKREFRSIFSFLRDLSNSSIFVNYIKIVSVCFSILSKFSMFSILSNFVTFSISSIFQFCEFCPIFQFCLNIFSRVK